MARRRTWWVWGVLWALAAPAPALAQDHQAFAAQRYDRGVELFTARRYDDALREFRMALELYSSPNARLFVARCLERLGQRVEARAEFERTARDAEDLARTDPRYAATSTAARAELRALDAGLGRVMVHAPAELPPDAQVEVAGRVIPRAALGLAVPVEPGVVRVRVSGPSFTAVERSVTVAAGTTQRVSLAPGEPVAATPSPRSGATGEAPRAQPAASSAPHEGATLATAARPVDTGVASGRGDAMRIAGAAAIVLGVTGGIGFGVLYGLALGELGYLRRICGETAMGPCTASPDEAVARGRAFEAAGYVALGVGIAALATGVALVVAAPASGRRAPAGLRAADAPRMRWRVTPLGVAGSF